MVELISANEANNLAVNHINVDKIVKDFLKMANESITDYAKNGNYFVKLACTEAINKVVYNRIEKALTDKGYEVYFDFPFIKIEWAKRIKKNQIG
jgi:hypothetical protein